MSQVYKASGPLYTRILPETKHVPQIIRATLKWRNKPIANPLKSGSPLTSVHQHFSYTCTAMCDDKDINTKPKSLTTVQYGGTSYIVRINAANSVIALVPAVR